MSNLPFGFTPGGGGGDMPDDLAGKIPLFAELEKLLSWQGGPVNWDLARQVAIRAAGPNDRPVTDAERTAVAEAMRLADHWLDQATTLPAGATVAEAWTRVQWIEQTVPVWQTLCDPVAARVSDAMGGAVPEEMRAMAGPLLGMMGKIGGLMFGAQVGQAVGNLAGEVVSTTDIGLPLGPAGRAALLPANVAAFGEGLGVAADEVRIYLALREAAHQRLFGHVPWLRGHLLGAVDSYARGITVDTGAIERAMTEIDPNDPESMQRALAGGMFEPQTTDAQKAALARLETMLALVEGWVDEVVDAAATSTLPAAGALRETVRRRRATGGPAEQTFATLVGLELRPRRLRDAAALWSALRDRRGIDGRDAIWGHPDLLPTAADLDDPTAYAAGSTDELSAEIEGFDQEP